MSRLYQWLCKVSCIPQAGHQAGKGGLERKRSSSPGSHMPFLKPSQMTSSSSSPFFLFLFHVLVGTRVPSAPMRRLEDSFLEWVLSFLCSGPGN